MNRGARTLGSRLARTVLVLAMAACSGAAVAEEPAAPAPQSFQLPAATPQDYFDTLKVLREEKVGQLDAIDFVKFRYAFLLARDEHDLDVPPDQESALRKAVEAEQNDEALQLCEEILAKDFTDIHTHIMRNFLREKQGADVSFYREVVARLAGSIFDSGDGRTPATAFHVFQVKEEYAVLRLARLQSRGQSLVREGGRVFDRMECETQNGATLQLYFDITEHFAVLRRSLGG